MSDASRTIESVRLIVGMEIHVELATRTKMFSAAPNPAHPDHFDASPNTLLDPVVLALPGALPVMNKRAVEMSIMVGLALRCSIAEFTKWDRKSYFYPDMPKAYQISQYDLPLCFDGVVDLPAVDEQGFPNPDGQTRRIGIIRAHLEEDAGKLLHEAPGGHAIDHSIVDLNRAGTPLLEIVTQPDFTSADDCVLFAKMLRNLCRFLGVTEGDMQKGHMRFEPNINCALTLSDGKVVRTPVVEIKNLNSFRSLKGAIEHELMDQPRRWREDGREMGPGMKITRGWDDTREVTFVQREKEDAHDYRYFPDPDLLPVEVSAEWLDAIKASLPELPMARLDRYTEKLGLSIKEASALIEEREVCFLFEGAMNGLVESGIDRVRAARVAANLLLQQGAKLANERGVRIHELGLSAKAAAEIALLREKGEIGNQAIEPLIVAACEEGNRGRAAREIAESLNLLIVRDDAALDGWVDQVLAKNPEAVADVKAGKMAAAGRLVGEVMKLAGGKADGKVVRERIIAKIE